MTHLGDEVLELHILRLHDLGVAQPQQVNLRGWVQLSGHRFVVQLKGVWDLVGVGAAQQGVLRGTDGKVGDSASAALDGVAIGGLQQSSARVCRCRL